MIKKFEKIRIELLKFIETEVENFLNENLNKSFYAFALDCNAEYAELNLCFNTEEDFAKTLNQYQNGNFSQHYQSEENINDLKYNTGDWNYQCFSSTNVFTEEELSGIFESLPEDDYKSWQEFVEELMQLFTKTLIQFSKTETFEKIAKTDDFKIFCIDHDEDLEDADDRMANIIEANG